MKLPSVPRVGDGGIEDLLAYDWPGNIREFANVVERALILNPSGPLTFENLDPFPGNARPRRDAEQFEPRSLDELVSEHITQTLARTRGKINGKDGAAAMMGVNPSTLRSRMQKLGLGGARDHARGPRPSRD